MIGLLTCLVVGQVTDPAARLQYTAPAECPPAAQFEAAVRARIPAANLHAESDHGIDVQVATSSGAFFGELIVSEGAHTFSPRRVSGADCGEVVSALALITALVLVSPPAKPNPPALAPPFAINTVRASVAAPPIGRVRAWRVAVAADLAVDVGIMPSVMVSVPVALSVGAVDGGQPGPAFRAALIWGAGSANDVARFVAVGFAFDACPWTLTAGDFRLDPCVALDAAVVRASGAELDRATTTTRPYLAVGALARGKWFFRPSWFIELSAGLRFPLVRDRFSSRDPDIVLHRVDPVVGGVQSGVGVIFW